MKFLMVILLATLPIRAESILKELNSDEIGKIDSGAMIFKTNKVKDRVWPEVILYQKINATNLESVAVFYALEHQQNYIPNLISATIISQEKPLETFVKYEMNMPWPLSNSKYIHGHILSRPSDDSYKVNWWMTESNSTEMVKGNVTFEKYKGATLMKYYSLVVPQSFAARFIKSRMFKDVKKSLLLTKKEIERVKREDQIFLKVQINNIISSFNGKFTFKK